MLKRGGKYLLLAQRHKWKVLWFLGGLLGIGALFYFFPLEWMELKSRWELSRSGIVERDYPADQAVLHGYERSTCGPKASACTCVAFIHGLADNALTWRRILDVRPEVLERMGLARPFRFLALDLPGSGKSPVPTQLENYRVRKQAAQVIAALKPVCSEWVLVGNSLGGWVATWVALDWPEGIRRLLLLAPAGLKSSSEGISSGRLLTEPTVESLKEFQKKAYFKPRSIPENVWNEIVRRAKTGHSREISAAQKEEDYLDSKFGSLRVPTLLVWGTEDRIIPIATGYKMRDLLRTLIWREIPECGHLPQKECPLPVIQGIVDLMNYGAM
ncbi:MAG: alpha/beta hydrolase [Bdellovibrio sp.]|nr:alpha/beta hydrolase [Bdellovibrio sp.]